MELIQEDATFDLLLVNRENLMSKVEIVAGNSGNLGHLGHSNHKAIEFKISVDSGKVQAKLQPSTCGEQTSGCSGN